MDKTDAVYVKIIHEIIHDERRMLILRARKHLR